MEKLVFRGIKKNRHLCRRILLVQNQIEMIVGVVAQWFICAELQIFFFYETF